MASLAAGLLIALGGAFLLAAGSELQSGAVATCKGQWRRFVRNPRWLLGSLLLAVAIGTNFLALALAPVSAIQSMSVVALALSAAIGICTGRIKTTKSLGLGITACLVGILGFIWIITGNHNPASYSDAAALLPAVTIIQATIGGCAGVCLVLSHFQDSKTGALASIMLAAMQFGTITTVFKVLVEITLQSGIGQLLSQPMTSLSLLSVAAGGIIAIALLQRAHRTLAPPTVVASLTIIDTITAATIGTLLLRETSLSTGDALVVLLCAAVAIAGVISLRDLQRRSPGNDVPTQIQTPKESSSHAHRVLQ